MSKSVNNSVVSYYYFKSPTPSDKRSFVQLKDSSLVYGKKAIYWEGLVSKEVVRLDGKPYPFDDVIGLQNQGHYYLKISDRAFAKRIINGKISVYEQYETQGDGRTYTSTFFQKENGSLTRVNSLSELARWMNDCKKAYDMVNITMDELYKMERKQPHYIQAAIETYNSCGE